MPRNSGPEAMSTTARPALVATVQIAWPAETPSAVADPVRRSPRSVLRMVRAVSCPGVQMTRSDTPRNARYRLTSQLSNSCHRTLPEGSPPSDRAASPPGAFQRPTSPHRGEVKPGHTPALARGSPASGEGKLVRGVRAQRVGAAGPAQLVERVPLQLAHRLAARAEPPRHLVQRALVSIAQAEPELDDPPLTRLEGAQHVVDLVLQVRLERRRRGRFRGGVLDQVAQLGVAILPDGGLERDRVARGLAECLD